MANLFIEGKLLPRSSRTLYGETGVMIFLIIVALLFEHGDLALVLAAAAWRRVAPMTASTVSDSRAVRGTKMRWVFERWSGGFTRNPRAWLDKVGGHESFEDFAIFEAQAHPETFRARAGSKRLARKRLGVAEFAHKIDSLDLAQVDGDNRPRGVQQFELAFMDELRGETYPETESRSILRTITFLCVEGMESGGQRSGARGLQEHMAAD